MSDDTRRCVRCGTLKPLSAFDKSTKRVAGRQVIIYCGACKACSSNYHRAPTRALAPVRRYKLDLPRRYVDGTASAKDIGDLVSAYAIPLRTYCGLDPFVARFQPLDKLVRHMKTLEKFPADEVEATIDLSKLAARKP